MQIFVSLALFPGMDEAQWKLCGTDHGAPVELDGSFVGPTSYLKTRQTTSLRSAEL